MTNRYARTSLLGLRVEATHNAYAAHILSCPSLIEHSEPCPECFSLCAVADGAAFAYGNAHARQQPAARA